MSIPGVSMEDPQPVQDGDPAVTPDGHDDADGLVETVKVGEQQMAPVSEVIKYRKQAKSLQKQLDTLQPQLEQARQIGQRLQEVQPLLEQVQRMTPQQRQAFAAGQVPSPAGTPHNTEDVEARDLAEDLGLIAQDGSLDIARARKRLDKDNARFERMLEERVAPMRQTTAQQAAQSLRTQARTVVDANGIPLATPESIDEAYAMLPPELASQPNVAMVALGVAGLIDRFRGRQPKAPAQTYGDPIFSEPAAGRRAGPSITADDKALAAKVGVTDKDLTSAVSAFQQSGGRGVRME